jgi:hypothetical protein
MLEALTQSGLFNRNWIPISTYGRGALIGEHAEAERRRLQWTLRRQMGRVLNGDFLAWKPR